MCHELHLLFNKIEKWRYRKNSFAFFRFYNLQSFARWNWKRVQRVQFSLTGPCTVLALTYFSNSGRNMFFASLLIRECMPRFMARQLGSQFGRHCFWPCAVARRPKPLGPNACMYQSANYHRISLWKAGYTNLFKFDHTVHCPPIKTPKAVASRSVAWVAPFVATSLKRL